MKLLCGNELTYTNLTEKYNELLLWVILFRIAIFNWKFNRKWYEWTGRRIDTADF